MFLHIPVANVFQCFSIQILFWVTCYRLDKQDWKAVQWCASKTDYLPIWINTKYKILNLQNWIPKLETSTLCNLEHLARQTHFAIWDKYILQFETLVWSGLTLVWSDSGLVWLWSDSALVCSGWPDWPDIIFTCMEYKTYGDRAIKLEKWPISSFGPSVNQSRWSVQEMLAHLKSDKRAYSQHMHICSIKAWRRRNSAQSLPDLILQ